MTKYALALQRPEYTTPAFFRLFSFAFELVSFPSRPGRADILENGEQIPVNYIVNRIEII